MSKTQAEARTKSATTRKSGKRRKNDLNIFEKTGLIALLCSPTELSRAWTGTDRVENVRGNVALELKELGFSEAGQDQAVVLMKKLFVQRSFFEGVADQLKESSYAGEEPHPERDEAAKIMAKLRAR